MFLQMMAPKQTVVEVGDQIEAKMKLKRGDIVTWIGCRSGGVEVAGFWMDFKGNSKVISRIYKWIECHKMRWMRLDAKRNLG